MAFKRELHEFLNELSENGELLAQYNDDPDQAMLDYGLGDEDRELLLHGSNDQIREKLKQEMKSHVAYVIRMG